MEWFVIGGEYTSLNFHSFVAGTAIILGPYKTRDEAESSWKNISAMYRHMAGYRFIILESPKKD